MKLVSPRLWRRIIPLAFLGATILFFISYQYPLPPEAAGLLWLARLDPLLAISTLRAEGAIPGWIWLSLITVVVTILFGRMFCGWICPLGALLAQIPSRLSRNKAPRIIYAVRYLWLTFIIILLLIGTNLPLYLTPFHLLPAELTRIWQGNIPWMLLGILLLGSLFFPRFWCASLCPTGLLLGALARWRIFRLSISAQCKNCSLCAGACRMKAARPGERQVAEDCVLCGRCQEVCPGKAIGWHQDEPRNKSEVMVLNRRNLLKGGAALAVAAVCWPVLRAEAAAIIRPPGALAEEDFLARCSRCGRCIKVCPSQALHPMPIEAGLKSFLTPQVIPRTAKCELCMLCPEVCPTGALESIPVDKVKMGTAKIDRGRCLVWQQQAPCLLCYEQCPVHAIEVDAAERPIVNEALCVGCGACEYGCPAAEPAPTVQPNARKV
jgi:ferredoxin-type protein NapF